MQVNVIHNESCLETMAQMPDEFVDCIITDPPYGISYQSARRTDKTQWKDKLTNDDEPYTEWLVDAYRVLRQNTPLVVFCEWRFQEVFRTGIANAGFTVKSHLIWDRGWHGMGDLKGAFAPQHDIAWFATKGRFEFPDKRPTTVMRFQRDDAESLIHPTQKPLALNGYLIKHLTTQGQLLYEPFCGSGSLPIAAHKLGRNWIGSEISAEYVELANKRLEPYLNQQSLF